MNYQMQAIMALNNQAYPAAYPFAQSDAGSDADTESTASPLNRSEYRVRPGERVVDLANGQTVVLSAQARNANHL